MKTTRTTTIPRMIQAKLPSSVNRRLAPVLGASSSRTWIEGKVLQKQHDDDHHFQQQHPWHLPLRSSSTLAAAAAASSLTRTAASMAASQASSHSLPRVTVSSCGWEYRSRHHPFPYHHKDHIIRSLKTTSSNNSTNQQMQRSQQKQNHPTDTAPPPTSSSEVAKTNPSSMVEAPRMEMVPDELQGKIIPFIDAAKWRALQAEKKQQDAENKDGDNKSKPKKKSKPNYHTAVLPCLGVWIIMYRGVEFMIGTPADTPVVIIHESSDGTHNPLYASEDIMDEIFPVARKVVEEAFSLPDEDYDDADLSVGGDKNKNKAKKKPSTPKYDPQTGSFEDDDDPKKPFGEKVQLLRTPQTLTISGDLSFLDDSPEARSNDDDVNPDLGSYNSERLTKMAEEIHETVTRGDVHASPTETLEAKVRVMVTFTHEGETYHITKVMEPLFMVARKDASKPILAPRLLLNRDEADRIMPILENAEFDMVSADQLNQLEEALKKADAEMLKEREVKV
ncbi:hypothetical protein ACA910_004308 [Epithemia clementina (nom. ined.)]